MWRTAWCICKCGSDLVTISLYTVKRKILESALACQSIALWALSRLMIMIFIHVSSFTQFGLGPSPGAASQEVPSCRPSITFASERTELGRDRDPSGQEKWVKSTWPILNVFVTTAPSHRGAGGIISSAGILLWAAASVRARTSSRNGGSVNTTKEQSSKNAEDEHRLPHVEKVGCIVYIYLPLMFSWFYIDGYRYRIMTGVADTSPGTGRFDCWTLTFVDVTFEAEVDSDWNAPGLKLF